MKKFNTPELVALLASKVDGKVTEEQAEQFISEFAAAMTNALNTTGVIEFRGFGNFFMRESKLKLMRNPKTGETFTEMTRPTPKFRPSRCTTKIMED